MHYKAILSIMNGESNTTTIYEIGMHIIYHLKL